MGRPLVGEAHNMKPPPMRGCVSRTGWGVTGVRGTAVNTSWAWRVSGGQPSAPTLPLLPVIVPRQPRRDHRVGDVLAGYPYGADAASVAVGPQPADPQRPAAQQLRQLLRRRLAEPRFLGAARRVRLRRVDARDPDARSVEVERVAVDHVDVLARDGRPARSGLAIPRPSLPRHVRGIGRARRCRLHLIPFYRPRGAAGDRRRAPPQPGRPAEQAQKYRDDDTDQRAAVPLPSERDHMVVRSPMPAHPREATPFGLPSRYR